MGDASATQCKCTSLTSHANLLSRNQRLDPVFPSLGQYWINRGPGGYRYMPYIVTIIGFQRIKR